MSMGARADRERIRRDLGENAAVIAGLVREDLAVHDTVGWI
jgi:hypothetical protein